MNIFREQVLHRIKLALHGGKDSSYIPRWIESYTNHPKDPDIPFSFDHHEFQTGIIADNALKKTIKKCSQVGLTEIAIRVTLAITAMAKGTNVIYTLPTSKFATKIAKTRIDPVIAASPTLKSLMNRDTDSSEVKQIGLSFLHIVGTFSSSAPISIPASALIEDEVDFSDQQVLSNYNSRTGHEEDGGTIIKFSTPTVAGYGIDLEYQRSSQGRYHILCAGCGKWQRPDFFQHVVIPGFDRAIIEFEKADLLNPRLFDHDTMTWVNEPYLQCPGCKRALTVENMADPDKREWVHAFPDRAHKGYHVVPYDVPTINPVSRTLVHIEDYKKKADWVNFKVGEVFEDADNSFLTEDMDQWRRVAKVPPEVGTMMPCFLGVDVGKWSYLTIGTEVQGRLHIIWLEKIHINQDLATTILKRVQQYRVVKGVIDAQPDMSTVAKVVNRTPEGTLYGCYYIRPGAGRTLKTLQVDDAKGVVKTSRTGSMDELVKLHNSQMMVYPECEEIDEVVAHMKNVKRTDVDGNDGNMQGVWQETGPDHWVHALNYLNMAYEMAHDSFSLGSIPVDLSVTGVAAHSDQDLNLFKLHR